MKGGKFLDRFSDRLLVDDCSATRSSMEDLPGRIRQSTSANHSVISFAVISIPFLREGRSTHPPLNNPIDDLKQKDEVTTT
jgi:hypothetical protein